ncbi:hypothetical protein DXA63_06165 [Segatella copri]|uniref:Uncharacterized protein n=1 Tax=Segatella copri TaxID=165179 RepID=A0AA92UM59_9BACT|nr:hypothetical protein DXA63_06165 [Segatella copri]
MYTRGSRRNKKLSPILLPQAGWGIFSFVQNFRMQAPHALKGQKLLAQGSALGYYRHKPVAL